MSINDLGREQGSPMDGQNKASSQEGTPSGKAEGGASAPRKKLVAVYRPQNSQQIKNRPAGQKKASQSSRQGSSDRAEGSSQKPQQASRAAETVKENSSSRDGQRPERSGDGQRGGFQGSRDGARSGFQGNRDGARRDSQGSRDGARGGFQGNRDGARRDG